MLKLEKDRYFQKKKI